MNAYSESTGLPPPGTVVPKPSGVIPRLRGVIPRLDRGIQRYTAFHQILAPTLDAAIKSRHDRLYVIPRLDPERRTGGIQRFSAHLGIVATTPHSAVQSIGLRRKDGIAA